MNKWFVKIVIHLVKYNGCYKEMSLQTNGWKVIYKKILYCILCVRVNFHFMTRFILLKRVQCLFSNPTTFICTSKILTVPKNVVRQREPDGRLNNSFINIIQLVKVKMQLIRLRGYTNQTCTIRFQQ